MKKLIYMLMALLGFGAASYGEESEEMPVEYGVPHVNFSLKARVVNESGEPIEGIRVCSDWPEIYSDEAGNINATYQVFPGAQNMAIFEDVDGEANGGEFERLELDIKDKVVQTADGHGGWCDGDFKAELGDVVMTLKSDVKSDE